MIIWTIIKLISPVGAVALALLALIVKINPNYNLNKFMKILHILSWILWFEIRAVGWLTGLVMVLVGFAVTKPGEKWPWYCWLWGNDEDDSRVAFKHPEQVNMDWYINEAAGAKWWNPTLKWTPNYHWFAFRNNFNNHRWVFKDREPNFAGDFQIDGLNARELRNQNRTIAYRWVYDGIFAGFKQVQVISTTKHKQWWFGWKLGHSTPGLGLTFRLPTKRDG